MGKMLHEIEKELTFLSFSTWFQTSRLLSIDEAAKTVIMGVKERFIGDVLRDRYQETLNKAAEKVLGEGYSVTVVDPQAGTERERRLRPLFFQRPVFPLYLFILPVSAPEPADWRKVMSPLNFPFAIIILMQSVD